MDGATAAATGAITGAVIVLGARAIIDLPTAIIALISLAVLWRFKIFGADFGYGFRNCRVDTLAAFAIGMSAPSLFTLIKS